LNSGTDLLSGTVSGNKNGGGTWTASFTDATLAAVQTYFATGAGQGMGLSAALTGAGSKTITFTETGTATITNPSPLNDVAPTGTVNQAAAEAAPATPLQTITSASGLLGGTLNITSSTTGLTTAVNITAGQ